MDERDLFRLLSEDNAQEFTKEAGLKDYLREQWAAAKLLGGKVLANKKGVAGAAIGAGLLGTGAYLSSRKSKKLGLSPDQRLSRRLLKNQLETEREAKREGKKLGLPHDMAKATVQANKSVADALAKHPKSAAFLGLLTGASAGYKIGPKVF